MVQGCAVAVAEALRIGAAVQGRQRLAGYRLKVLLEQQAQMQAGMQLRQYQTLAQQIAASPRPV